MGKNLKRGASLIGCNIIHASKGNCEGKGKIERVLRTCHERLEQEMIALGKGCATLDEYNTYLQAYIGQDYNRKVHSETGEMPEEQFFSFPAKLRRWISKDSLAMIFLPVCTASVSKVGLVRVNNLKYLVNDSTLWGKKVDVRSGYFDKSKVYIWFLDYWEFTSLPFPKVINPSSAFLNEHHKNTLQRLTQLLHTREVGVVVGEAGTGKSTLLDIFLAQLSSSRYKIIRIDNPQNKPREMYRGISSAMGVNTTWFGADALKVVDLLTYSYLESNRPNLLIIDESHVLGPAMLNELRLLTNAKIKNEPLFTLILFGQPALSSTLKLPAMIPLAQRIGAWITLKPMSEEEAVKYIDWHIKNAGSDKEIFLPEAKKAIYRRSQGNARMINRLCWECLNQGCLDGVKTITEELFSFVCKNLGPHLAN